MNRRSFLASGSALPAALVLAARDDATRAPVGIGSASYAIHVRQIGRGFLEPLRFLQFCHERGAAGIQAPLGVLEPAEARRVREAAERRGMYVEGSVTLPREEDLERFRAELRTVRACGGEVARTYCLAGRRYEAFPSAEAYRAFLDASRRALQRAEPVARAEGVRLAVENHKDREAGQLGALLAEIDSEAVGATVDLGNDLALLGTPEETVRQLAPFAAAAHLKDARVAGSEDGFRLDDAPLGEGIIDWVGLSRRLRAANPRLRLTLEMITRDPLPVPCLDEGYWHSCDASGRRLAAMLRFVRRHESDTLSQVGGLPPERQRALEDQNVRACLDRARVDLADL